jgi:hypothetical protein
MSPAGNMLIARKFALTLRVGEGRVSGVIEDLTNLDGERGNHIERLHSRP